MTKMMKTTRTTACDNKSAVSAIINENKQLGLPTLLPLLNSTVGLIWMVKMVEVMTGT